ncbi:MAG: hypothetical protein A2V66_07870 [Ignavibacteria bacterium RBG_13_36_8]|nr:MAG: hypothetical protein A2V66_07870 [Ignavibacteria bacterium RBG_13_36_8]
MKLSETLNEVNLTREDIVFLLKLNSPVDIACLLERADLVRKESRSRNIDLHGLVKFSNHCEENCYYCKSRKDNFSIKRYRLSADEIIEIAKLYLSLGISNVILYSGLDYYYDTDMVSYIIYSIKKDSNVSITLSLGERKFDEYKAWRIAGAEKYLLRHKTANRLLFSMHHNRDRLLERINHLEMLKRSGYKIGTGCIVGLPSQTEEDIADDILLCKRLGVEMVSFSRFLPQPFTPYQNKNIGSEIFVIKAIAVARLVLRDADIPTYIIFNSDNINDGKKFLNNGANILSMNLTSQLPDTKDPKHIGPYANNNSIDVSTLKENIQSLLTYLAS